MVTGMVPFRMRASRRNLFRTRSEIVEANGENAGYLQTAVGPDEVVLKELHIDQAFQNRGIGSEVLRMLLAEAARLSKPVTVTVVTFNPALAFYRRAGFRIVSEQDQRFRLCHNNNSSL